MPTPKLKFTLSLIFSIFLTLGLSLSLQTLLADWEAPLATPPTCVSGNPGCDAPVNVSETDQMKGGKLGVGNDFNYPAGSYLGNPAAPIKLLHLLETDGNGSNENAELDIQSVPGTNNYWGLYHNRGDESLRFWYDRTDNGGTADDDVLTILKSGNVGIGITNPLAKLQIGGVAGTDGILFPDGTLQTSAASGGFANPATGDLDMNGHNINGANIVSTAIITSPNIIGSGPIWTSGTVQGSTVSGTTVSAGSLSTSLINAGASFVINNNSTETLKLTTSKLTTYGGLQLGNQTVIATCNSANEGTMRYNSTTKNQEFCDGSNWRSVQSTVVCSKTFTDDYDQWINWTTPATILGFSITGGGGGGGGTCNACSSNYYYGAAGGGGGSSVLIIDSNIRVANGGTGGVAQLCANGTSGANGLTVTAPAIGTLPAGNHHFVVKVGGGGGAGGCGGGGGGGAGYFGGGGAGGSYGSASGPGIGGSTVGGAGGAAGGGTSYWGTPGAPGVSLNGGLGGRSQLCTGGYTYGGGGGTVAAGGAAGAYNGCGSAGGGGGATGGSGGRTGNAGTTIGTNDGAGGGGFGTYSLGGNPGVVTITYTAETCLP